MKKVVLIMFLFVCLHPSAYSQAEIEATYIKPEYSKVAEKAYKKNDLGFFGNYWNADSTKIFHVVGYRQKKTDVPMTEILTFDTEGELQQSETFEMEGEEVQNHEFMKAQKTFNKNREAGLNDLNEVSVAYFSSPMLAGKPTLEYGTFKPIYDDETGIFKNYQVSYEDGKSLDERFWVSVAQPLEEKDELNIDKNQYLINQGDNVFQGLAKIIEDDKNSKYMSVDAPALVCGPMATNEMTKFLSGVMDLKTGNWLHKHVIEVPESSGRKHKTVRLENGHTVIQLTTKTGIMMLTVDETGAEVSRTPVEFDINTGKKMLLQDRELIEYENGYINFCVFNRVILGMPFLGISQTENGKEIKNTVLNLSELGENAIIPDKSKIKGQKIKSFGLSRYYKVDDTYFIEGEVNIQDKYYYGLLEMKELGEISAFYIFPKPTLEDMGVEKYRPIHFKKINDDEYYITMGMKVKMYSRGINSAADMSGLTFTYTLYTFRIEYDRTYVGVMKLNTEDKTLSNTTVTNHLVYGDAPGVVLDNGAMYMESGRGFFLVK